jgi:hypothetical protein
MLSRKVYLYRAPGTRRHSYPKAIMNTDEKKPEPIVPQPVNDRWRLDVRSSLAIMGWSYSDLARAVGGSPSGMSQLLATDAECKRSPGKKAVWISVYAQRVSEATGVPLPMALADGELASFMEMAVRLEKRRPGYLDRMRELMAAALQESTEHLKKSSSVGFTPDDTAGHGATAPSTKPAAKAPRNDATASRRRRRSGT